VKRTRTSGQTDFPPNLCSFPSSRSRPPAAQEVDGYGRLSSPSPAHFCSLPQHGYFLYTWPATLRSWSWVFFFFFLHPSFQGLDLQWMDPGEWRRRQSTFRPSRSSGVELKAGIRSTSQRGPTRELPRGPPDRRPHH
jgi:hypothetical protein